MIQLIFSLDKPERNFRWQPDAALKFLSDNNLEVRLAEGYFEGRQELSYIVQNPTPNQFYTIEKLCRDYAQDSVLLVDDDSIAWIIDLTTLNETSIGVWRSVSQSEAIAGDGYTYDLESGTYYVAR